jgi:crotonobetainyl-CoA:carnitine CoA-transferase CaiB-like acyl-CoA transferase
MTTTIPVTSFTSARLRASHPDLPQPSPYLGPALPIRFSRADAETAPAEPLGASAEAVLRELLGADDAELARLRAAGALG